jgi:hypothetical protein
MLYDYGRRQRRSGDKLGITSLQFLENDRNRRRKKIYTTLIMKITHTFSKTAFYSA